MLKEILCDERTALWAPILTTSVVVAFVAYGPVEAVRRRTGMRVPEAGFGYSERSLNAYLDEGGKGIDRLYRRALRWDIAFCILLGVGWTVALGSSFARVVSDGSPWVWLALVPLLVAAVDLTEDAILLTVVHPDPGCHTILRRGDLVKKASAVTKAKWMLVCVALLVTSYGYVKLAIWGFNP